MLPEQHPDSERAGDQWEKILQKPVNLFDWRDCALAEESADETFNRRPRRFVRERRSVKNWLNRWGYCSIR
jgi:hypothetical protein